MIDIDNAERTIDTVYENPRMARLIGYVCISMMVFLALVSFDLVFHALLKGETNG